MDLDSIADSITKRGFATPVIFLLEASKPLRGILNVSTSAFAPLIGSIIGISRIAEIGKILQDPESFESLIKLLEERRQKPL